MKTDYDFSVTAERELEQIPWYLPNEIGGVTMMFPEDY